MLVRVDILDDRLEAIEADDDRERLRRYLELWREGAVDPLRDPGTVLVVAIDDGLRPRAPAATHASATRGCGPASSWPTTAPPPRRGAVTSPPPPALVGVPP